MYNLRSTFLVLLVFLSTSILATGNLSAKTIKSALLGRAAPDVVLTQTEGVSTSVIGSRQGKKAILVFWATWCPHCYEDLGAINENFASIEQKGIKVILVDVGENTQTVKNYFNHRQMKLISFIDEDSYLQDTYHLAGIPTLVFIDEKGIIRSMTHQFPSDYENHFGV